MNNETETQAITISTGISPGFDTADNFALLQRAAKMLSNSSLVPPQYRAVKEVKEYGKVVRFEDNPNAVSNCIIALNIARRVRADELSVMQNLYIVEGRPSWSSQWIIACVNQCGRFSPLRFELTDLGEEDVEYSVSEWENGKKLTRKERQKIRNIQCVAWVVERSTGERLEGPPVSMKMSVVEGWYGKAGSKWQTMPEVMLRYRAASFFGKLYAPELLMGLPSAEESLDEYSVREVTGREVEPATLPAPAMFSDPAPAPAAEPKKPRTTKKETIKDIPDKDLGKPADETPAPANGKPQQGPHEVVVDDDGKQVGPTLVEQFWAACDLGKMDRVLVADILRRNGLLDGEILTEDEAVAIQPIWAKLKSTYAAEAKKGGAQ